MNSNKHIIQDSQGFEVELSCAMADMRTVMQRTSAGLDALRKTIHENSEFRQRLTYLLFGHTSYHPDLAIAERINELLYAESLVKSHLQPRTLGTTLEELPSPQEEA